jgi:transcription-repair coupling factor (superfamily II helicase)
MPPAAPGRGADLALWEPLVQSPFFQAVAAAVRRGETGLALHGLVAGARALLLDLLVAATGRPLLAVVPDDTALEAVRRDLAALAPLAGGEARRVVVLPAMDADPWAGVPPHPEIVRERVVALGAVARREVDLLLVPARALLQWFPSPAEFGSWSCVLRQGESAPPERFVLQAMSLGYRRVDTVGSPGEVSRRGGIIDIFPPALSQPVRIELFGDSVDSLRSFDTDNQRSTGRLDEVRVGPAVECPPTDDALRRLAARLEARLGEGTPDPVALRAFRGKLDTLQEQGEWPGLEALGALLLAEPVLLFAHAPDMALVVDEPARVEEELIRAAHEAAMSWEETQERFMPPPRELHADPRDALARLSEATLVLEELAGGARGAHEVACRPARVYSGRIGDLAGDLRGAPERPVRTVCVMRARGSAERLMELLREYELAPQPAEAAGREHPPPGGLFVGVGALRAGFEFPGLGLVVLGERDVFGEERPAADRKGGSRAAFVSDFRDLKPGDLVVHVDHGMARYAGLGRPKGGSLNRDFVVLEFSGGDRLFVPVDRLDLVQRYTGVAGSKPALDRLGGPGWERVKSRVRTSVARMAKDLLDLYARRAAARGHAFSPDTAWQSELEAAFPHDLTPDQARALDEVKREMESERAMDRLLVGDVGFGKTEIAVRVAFKAVMDGRQVALLAPTTVLAFQHHQTFSERFAPFPVRVELVSRFRSPAEIRQVLEGIETGAVDVLIGTHRMLSQDVRFKKLGLLLVDEEQRFGVAHKERLKHLSVGVDVLTLTATPIPRTLQMSMAGVRDLSVIETPPPGRLAIQTYLVPFRKSLVAQALRQELRREGQSFVVHNRIDTLPALARAIGELVPEARVAMAHGQMSERQLEAVMLRFVNREADVLVTTTLIENGLDIPSANTILVNRADRMGLAQLYQLRGRVGRSHHHAYCYFMIPSRHDLTDEARKRLKALQEFSELGAGFRLAAADLEIRGAGELLGPRQHGHIAALGFDLYCQLLERAVAELKGEAVPERRPPSLHLGVDIRIPESYLPDPGHRLALYKRLAQATSAEEIDRLQSETEDRYGHLPPAATNLFDLARLRLAAEGLQVKSVDVVDDKLRVRFHDGPSVALDRLLALVAREGGSLTPGGALVLPAPAGGAERIRYAASVLAGVGT